MQALALNTGRKALFSSLAVMRVVARGGSRANGPAREEYRQLPVEQPRFKARCILGAGSASHAGKDGWNSRHWSRSWKMFPRSWMLPLRAEN